MRSSAVLSLVALTAVVPACAAPVAPKPQFAKRQTTSHQAKREPEESGAFVPIRFDGPPRFPFPGHHYGAVARAAGDLDLSGAISIPWRAIVDAAPKVIQAATAVWDIFKHKREYEEVLTRELGSEFIQDLAARSDDESGAFWGAVLKWAPTVISAVSSFLNKRDIDELLTHGDAHLVREFEEHLTRELSARGDLESGAAIPWGTIIKWAPTVISAVSSFFNKRDVAELMARGDEYLVREFEEHLTRELSARDNLESGAGLFGTLVKWAPVVAPMVIDAVSGLFKHKRDFEEFVARSGLEARSLNELD